MIKAAVNDYFDYSTIHGLGRAKNSPFIVLKVLWILCLCASLGVIVWQVTELYEKFKSEPISTTIEATSPLMLEFPEISICNVNGIRYSKLQDHPLKDFIQNTSEKYSVGIDIFNITDTTEIPEELDLDILTYAKEKIKMGRSLLASNELEAISQTFEDFILACSFAGLTCNKSAFIRFRTYEYGFCYKFDPSVLGVLDYSISAAGTRYALELIFNVGQNDAVPSVASSAGVVMEFLHHKHAHQYELDDYVFIPTGFEASVRLNQIRSESVQWKGSNKRCEEFPHASVRGCAQLCHAIFMSYFCDCSTQIFNYDELMTTLNDTITDYPPCSTDEHYECLQSGLQYFISTELNACDDCIQPCRDIAYERDVSLIKWPSDKVFPILRHSLKSKLPDVNESSITGEFMRENLVKARIYLKTLTYYTIKEEYSYTAVNFISDIGGQLGLWAGFSVLSLLELVELLLIVCASSVQSSKKNKDGVVPIND